MLTLILGRGKSGKTSMLLEAVRTCPAMGMAQRIVIVPEQLGDKADTITADGAELPLRLMAELFGDNDDPLGHAHGRTGTDSL